MPPNPIPRFEMLQQPPLPAPMGPDAVEEPASPPPPLGPAHERTALAAKALTYLWLASAWVASVSFGGAAAIEAAVPGCEEGCHVNNALFSASMAGCLFTMLFALVGRLLVWRAGLRVVFTTVPGPPSGSLLQTTAPLAAGPLAALAFFLLSLAGCLLLVVLAAAQESLTRRRVMAEVGVVGSVAITCFVFIPITVMNVWRMKLRGDTSAGNI